MAARIKVEQGAHPIRRTQAATASLSAETILADRSGDLRAHNNMEIDQPMTPNSGHEDMAPAIDTMHALGVHSRYLIQTIQKLDALNIDAALPSLPKFVVVGDQSAGKSSIVEALCHVMLPRNVNTCTRVPFMITTTASNGPWQCNVSLQIKFNYDATSHETFDQWTERALSTHPFKHVRDKSELGLVLTAAQHALLDPTGNIAAYSPHTVHQSQLLFSPNIICLEISGPELPELSFYDLPGSINIVDNEKDQHLVGFVENLIKSYIEDDKALILLACAADVDIENSTTFKFVRQCKAERRCLGVLTKPDLLQRARIPHISKMLDGAAFKLGRGWYVSKQPSQSQLEAGITQAEALEAEQAFFSAGLFRSELSRHSSRFGVSNLQTAISSELREHILDNIGEIVDRVQTRGREIDESLALFREKDLHPMMTIFNLISDIKSTIFKNIEGGAEGLSFRPELQRLKVDFKNDLKNMAPDFDATTPEQRHQQSGLQNDAIMLDDSDDEPVSTPSGKRKATATPQTNKRRKESTPVNAAKVIFTIPQIYSIRDTHTVANIPGQIDPKVTDVIIRRTLEGWSNTLDTLLENVEALVQGMVLETIDNKLLAFKSCPIHHKSKQQALRYLMPLFESQKTESRRILARELHKPATLSDMTILLNTAREELSKKRQRKRLLEKLDRQEAAGNKPMSVDDKRRKLEDAKELSTLGHDQHLGIYQLLAVPFAYYQTATSRFVDNIALQLEMDLVSVLGDGVQEALAIGLGTSDPATCEALLVEDAERDRERQRLVAERSRLMAAMQELKELPHLNG